MNNPKPIIKPEYYFQPVRASDFKRVLENDKEFVSYLSNASMRIWLNKEAIDWDSHWHTAIEIIMPIENSFTVIVDGSVFVLKPGDIFIIPPKRIHILKAPPSGSRMVYLFDMETFTRLRTFSYIQPLFMSPVLLNKTTVPEIYEEVQDLFLKIGNAYFEFGDLRELIVYSLLLQFFALYGTHHLSLIQQEMTIAENKKQTHYGQMEYVIEYINEHYQDSLTLETIAELANLSKYHFDRLFKRYTNFSFYEYLTLRRLDEVVNLLSDGSLSITEIALQSGFSNISSFNRTFKKYKNCSPRQFQERKTRTMTTL